MLNEKEVKFLHAKIQMAEKKREFYHTKSYQHYHRLYAGEEYPLTSDISDTKLINVNLTRPNVEISKPAVFLKNPKIFITNKQDFIDTGKKHSITKAPIVLDGYRMAQTLQDAINPLVNEINLQDEMSKCRDDNLIGSYSGMFVGYNTEFGVDEEENEYIKDEEIYVQRQDPDMVGVDPELNEFDLSKAKFFYRVIIDEWQEVKKNPHYKNTSNLESSDLGYGDSILDATRRRKKLLDFAGAEFAESDEAKKVVLYEIWLKPTPSEKRKGEKGKVIVLAKGHNKALREDTWPLDLDGFPVELSTFNRMNDRFYPPFDLQFYEPQLNEQNKLRTYQLQNAKTVGNFKVFFNADEINEEEINKLLTGDNVLVPLRNLGGADIRTKVMVMTPGSPSAEFYLVDQKIARDIEHISLLPETKKGIRPTGRQTATEVRIEAMAANTQPAERLEIMATFYIRIIRKIIQLMKQFYDIKKMRQITGKTEVEWTDFGFSTTSIKNEFDIQIDIASMLPKNEAVERRQALDIADRILRLVESPPAMAKLIQEGTNLNLTEALVEVSKKFEIKNDKILEKMGEAEQQQAMQFIQLLMQSRPGTAPKTTGVPSEASEMSRAEQPIPAGVSGV